MAFQRQYNYNNQGGNQYYQRNNTGDRQGYQQPVQVLSPEEFINERLDVYAIFESVIRDRGLDPDKFTFGLTQWVTSYCMAKKGK